MIENNTIIKNKNIKSKHNQANHSKTKSKSKESTHTELKDFHITIIDSIERIGKIGKSITIDSFKLLINFEIIFEAIKTKTLRVISFIIKGVIAITKRFSGKIYKDVKALNDIYNKKSQKTLNDAIEKDNKTKRRCFINDGEIIKKERKDKKLKDKDISNKKEEKKGEKSLLKDENIKGNSQYKIEDILKDDEDFEKNGSKSLRDYYRLNENSNFIIEDSNLDNDKNLLNPFSTIKKVNNAEGERNGMENNIEEDYSKMNYNYNPFADNNENNDYGNAFKDFIQYDDNNNNMMLDNNNIAEEDIDFNNEINNNNHNNNIFSTNKKKSIIEETIQEKKDKANKEKALMKSIKKRLTKEESYSMYNSLIKDNILKETHTINKKAKKLIVDNDTSILNNTESNNNYESTLEGTNFINNMNTNNNDNSLLNNSFAHNFSKSRILGNISKMNLSNINEVSNVIREDANNDDNDNNNIHDINDISRINKKSKSKSNDINKSLNDTSLINNLTLNNTINNKDILLSNPNTQIGVKLINQIKTKLVNNFERLYLNHTNAQLNKEIELYEGSLEHSYNNLTFINNNNLYKTNIRLIPSRIQSYVIDYNNDNNINNNDINLSFNNITKQNNIEVDISYYLNKNSASKFLNDLSKSNIIDNIDSKNNSKSNNKSFIENSIINSSRKIERFRQESSNKKSFSNARMSLNDVFENTRLGMSKQELVDVDNTILEIDTLNQQHTSLMPGYKDIGNNNNDITHNDIINDIVQPLQFDDQLMEDNNDLNNNNEYVGYDDNNDNNINDSNIYDYNQQAKFEANLSKDLFQIKIVNDEISKLIKAKIGKYNSTNKLFNKEIKKVDILKDMNNKEKYSVFFYNLLVNSNNSHSNYNLYQSKLFDSDIRIEN